HDLQGTLEIHVGYWRGIRSNLYAPPDDPLGHEPLSQYRFPECSSQWTRYGGQETTTVDTVVKFLVHYGGTPTTTTVSLERSPKLVALPESSIYTSSLHNTSLTVV
ncbi:hypothetical protein HAX54_037051, partial [Datura stramonium]|nr:hypothetical protein [Datura stramonium]